MEQKGRAVTPDTKPLKLELRAHEREGSHVARNATNAGRDTRDYSALFM